MMAETGKLWVNGSFIVTDRSDDDRGLDRTIGDVRVRPAPLGTSGGTVAAATSDLDTRLAALLAGLFRQNVSWGSLWHPREHGGSELHIVFDGSGVDSDTQLIENALAALAELGVEGKVESIEIGLDGPQFTLWSVSDSDVRIDVGGHVVYSS